MSYEEHTCERAKKFYSRYYRGTEGHQLGFDTSHADLVPTSTVEILNKILCAHCLNPAKYIQAGLRALTPFYDSTGYTCVCEKTMDEIELAEKINNIKEECRVKIQEARKAANLSIDHVAISDLFIQFLKKKTETYKTREFNFRISDFSIPKVNDLIPKR